MSESQPPDALMPLSLAAVEAYEAATGKRPADAEVLNNVARVMATRTRLFSRRHGSDEFFLVWPEEIVEGRLLFGGEVINFTDGRPSLENLSILREQYPHVAAEIKALYGKR